MDLGNVGERLCVLRRYLPEHLFSNVGTRLDVRPYKGPHPKDPYNRGLRPADRSDVVVQEPPETGLDQNSTPDRTLVKKYHGYRRKLH